ncbi:MAG: ligand-binding protein SH3, partial [Thermodesulfobacteriota bacterium]|nr:ligand-binding protein SH3 [Thermodesulfobacteriota bacterium]
VFDNRAHIVQDINDSFFREHSRIFMGGATSNIALGNWLLKGEAAWFDGLEYANLVDQEVSRLDVMAGIEYMGFSETVLSLEIVNRHLVDFDEQLTLAPDIAQEDTMQTVAKLVRDFANDTIQLKILLSIFGGHGEDGMFERFQLDYDLTDAMTLTGGVIFYQSGDQGALSGIEDNDRAFFELSYEF